MSFGEGRVSRRSFLKGVTGSAVVLGAIPLTGFTARAQAKPFDFGDITITWAGVFFYYVPVVVAREKGFLEEEQIEIGEIITSRGGTSTVQNFISGNLLVAEPASPATALAIAKQGLDATIVAGGVKSLGSIGWLTQPDSPLFTIQDLQGKKASFTRPGSVTQSTIALSLGSAPGIEPGDVERIAAGGVGAGIELLRNEEIDAAATLEPITSTSAADLRLFFFGRSFVPDFFQTFWIARNDFLGQFPQDENHPMTRLLRARKKGLQYTLENPHEAASIVGNAQSSPLEPEVAFGALGRAGVFSGAYHSDSQLIGKGLVRTEQGMQVTGQISPDETVPFEQIIDQGYLPVDIPKISIPVPLEVGEGESRTAQVPVDASDPFVNVRNFGPGVIAVKAGGTTITELPPTPPKVFPIPVSPGRVAVQVRGVEGEAKVRVF